MNAKYLFLYFQAIFNKTLVHLHYV